MANYFYALLNFFCSFALMLRNYDFLTIGKVSSPNSALELNLGLRISLLAHLPFTGTNQTLLRVPTKLMLSNRTEIPQIFLVHANYPSYNQSTTSKLPPDNIRANSNGGNPRLRYLGIDFLSPPLRPGKPRPLHRNSVIETRNIEVNSSHQYALVKNKKSRSLGTYNFFLRLAMPRNLVTGNTNWLQKGQKPYQTVYSDHLDQSKQHPDNRYGYNNSKVRIVPEVHYGTPPPVHLLNKKYTVAGNHPQALRRAKYFVDTYTDTKKEEIQSTDPYTECTPRIERTQSTQAEIVQHRPPNPIPDRTTSGNISHHPKQGVTQPLMAHGQEYPKQTGTNSDSQKLKICYDLMKVKNQNQHDRTVNTNNIEELLLHHCNFSTHKTNNLSGYTTYGTKTPQCASQDEQLKPNLTNTSRNHHHIKSEKKRQQSPTNTLNNRLSNIWRTSRPQYTMAEHHQTHYDTRSINSHNMNNKFQQIVYLHTHQQKITKALITRLLKPEATLVLLAETESWNLMRFWGQSETFTLLIQSEIDGQKPSQQRHPAHSSRPTTQLIKDGSATTGGTDPVPVSSTVPDDDLLEYDDSLQLTLPEIRYNDIFQSMNLVQNATANLTTRDNGEFGTHLIAAQTVYEHCSGNSNMNSKPDNATHTLSNGATSHMGHRCTFRISRLDYPCLHWSYVHGGGPLQSIGSPCYRFDCTKSSQMESCKLPMTVSCRTNQLYQDVGCSSALSMNYSASFTNRTCDSVPGKTDTASKTADKRTTTCPFAESELLPCHSVACISEATSLSCRKRWHSSVVVVVPFLFCTQALRDRPFNDGTQVSPCFTLLVAHTSSFSVYATL